MSQSVVSTKRCGIQHAAQHVARSTTVDEVNAVDRLNEAETQAVPGGEGAAKQPPPGSAEGEARAGRNRLTP
jgi:hypothetical protein